uniref:Lipoprotein n=1 Tax=Strongyloides papillosus TaxID=174720 RepID=A0A0N5CIS7_STREA
MKVFKILTLFIIITISCIVIDGRTHVTMRVKGTPKCLEKRNTTTLIKENVTATLMKKNLSKPIKSEIGSCGGSITIKAYVKYDSIMNNLFYVNFNYSVSGFSYTNKIPKDCEKAYGISSKMRDYFCDFTTPTEKLFKDLCRNKVIFCLNV